MMQKKRGKTMKRTVAAILTLVLLFCISVNAFADAYGSVENAKKGVARVIAVGDLKIYTGNVLIETKSDVILWSGSAFAVGESGKPVSYFVTNRHVASKNTEYDQDDMYKYTLIPKSFYVVMDNAGTKNAVDIVAVNASGPDLAIIKLKEPTTQREALRLHEYEDASKLNTTTVYSIGFPGSQAAFLDKSHEYASGIDMISARKGVFDHEIDAQHTGGEGILIQTDTPVSHGNSGGPLVDEKGGVLGVCTFGTSDSGMNAAVSVKEVIKLLDKNKIAYETDTSSLKAKVSWVIYGIAGVVILGAMVMLVMHSRKKKPQPIPDAPNPVAAPAKHKLAPTQSVRTLIGVNGPMQDRRFILEEGQTLYIGRDKTRCRVCFDEGTAGISNVHCKISFDGRTATITDLKSSYGTFVDHKKLAPYTAITLHRGLAVDIGSESNRFTLQ